MLTLRVVIGPDEDEDALTVRLAPAEEIAPVSTPPSPATAVLQLFVTSTIHQPPAFLPTTVPSRPESRSLTRVPAVRSAACWVPLGILLGVPFAPEISVLLLPDGEPSWAGCRCSCPAAAGRPLLDSALLRFPLDVWRSAFAFIIVVMQPFWYLQPRATSTTGLVHGDGEKALVAGYEDSFRELPRGWQARRCCESRVIAKNSNASDLCCCRCRCRCRALSQGRTPNRSCCCWCFRFA